MYSVGVTFAPFFLVDKAFFFLSKIIIELFSRRGIKIAINHAFIMTRKEELNPRRFKGLGHAGQQYSNVIKTINKWSALTKSNIFPPKSFTASYNINRPNATTKKESQERCTIEHQHQVGSWIRK